jgi:hypothetical protein
MTKLSGIEEHFPTADIRATGTRPRLDKRVPVGLIGGTLRSGSTIWQRSDGRSCLGVALGNS